MAKHPVALTPGSRDVTYMNDLVRSYVTHLEASGKSPETIRSRQYLLRRLDAELPEGLDAFSTEDLEDWLGGKRSGGVQVEPFTGWTLYTYVTTVKDFGRYAVTAGHEFDPTADLEQPKAPDGEPRPATDEELQHALANLKGVALTAVILAAFNSLRCGEIARLHRKHGNEATIWVSRKGAKTQLLPTHEMVWRRLVDMPPGPVVRTPRGREFSSPYLSQVVSAELTRIGLPDVTLHRFRATFATRLANAGVHATVIQDLMGHKSLATTQRYMKVTNEQRALAMTALLVPASLLEAA